MERIKINFTVKSDDSTTLDQMKEDYKKCPAAVKYLNGLGVPEEAIIDNITKVNDMVRDINYCKKCPGIKNCQKENRLIVTKLVYDGRVLDRQMSPCPKYLERVAFEKQYLIRDFDDSWLESTIQNVDKNKGRIEAIAKFQNFINNGMNDWIYLNGASNSGRSFLAAVLTNESIRKGKGPVCFMDSSKRLRMLSDLYYKDKEEFQNQLDAICNSKVVVLDDFGNEYKTDFIRDAIVFPIISYRASKKLFTIITSDFTINEIVTLYSTSKTGEVRAKQIGNLIKTVSKKEISLGELSIY